ncbi:MAG: polysaccharide lyase [Planctomycetota bacterium]
MRCPQLAILSLILLAGGNRTASGDVLLSQDFSDAGLGQYTDAEMRSAFPEVPWTQGFNEGRATIVDDGRKGHGLEMFYPQGTFGPGQGGGQAPLQFADGAVYDELVFSYSAMFRDGFDWQKGGKLPGLASGWQASGGNAADGTNGFTARMMWRTGGKLVQYVYHMDTPGGFGEDFTWQLDGEDVLLETDRWYDFRTRVKLNTPGEADGEIESWLDGERALHVTGLRFRTVNGVMIDNVYFSTFFGGGDDTWAPDNDSRIVFDNFLVVDPDRRRAAVPEPAVIGFAALAVPLTLVRRRRISPV